MSVESNPVELAASAYHAAREAHEVACADVQATASPLDTKYGEGNTRGQVASAPNARDYDQGSLPSRTRALAHVRARRHAMTTEPALRKAQDAYRRALDEADGLTAILEECRASVVAADDAISRGAVADIAANRGALVATCLAVAQRIQAAVAPIATARKAAGLPAPSTLHLPTHLDAQSALMSIGRWALPAPSPAAPSSHKGPSEAELKTMALDEEEQECLRDIRKYEALAAEQAKKEADYDRKEREAEAEKIAKWKAQTEAGIARRKSALEGGE